MIKNNSKSGTLINLIIAAVLTAIFVFVVRYFYVFTYGVVDDPFIETVLSGAYTGEASALVVYIKLPLAWLLKTLLEIAPSINWHFMYLAGCFVVSVFLVVFRICSNVGKLLHKLIFSILFILLFMFCLMKLFVGAHYSMCAGVLTGTAIFYFLTIKYDSSKLNIALNYIVCLLLLYNGYCLRARTLFMLMPLAFVAFIYKFFKEKPAFKAKNIIRWVIFPAALFIGIGIIELAHSSAYKSEEWKEFLKFNDARTTLYDFYGVPSYEGNEEFYDGLGISKERVYMYKEKYYLEFTDGMEEDFLEKIADYSVEKSYEKVPFGERIVLSLKALPAKLAEKTYKPMSYISAVLLLIVLICAAFAKKWRVFVNGILSVIAFLIPWAYMIFMGKPVARVTSGIYYAEIIFLLALIIDNASDISAWMERKNNAAKTVKVIVSLAIAIVLAAGMFFGVYKNASKANKTINSALASGRVRLALEDWCQQRQDTLFIYESEIIYLGYIENEMDNQFVNLYWPGGWPAKMPQGKDIWNKYGITSIEKAIVENDNVKIIAYADTDMTYWLDFYRDRYPKVKLNKEDNLDFYGTEFAVYSIGEF